MRLNGFFLAVCLASATLQPAATAQQAAKQPNADQKAQLQAYVDALRKDVRAERQSIVDQAMGLEAGDKAKFWGVYEKYQAEMKTLWDQRLANIKKYAENFETITPALADELASGGIANRQQSLAIIKKYHPLMKTALGSKAAARFVQTEVMLNNILDAQIGAQIPLMPN